jgi:cephalosporin hydroxylase
MKLTIDRDANSVVLTDQHGQRQLPFYSKEAYELLSELWLPVSWHEKYSYTFTWFGRPIVQYPEDMIRLQEVIYRVKPTVIY